MLFLQGSRDALAYPERVKEVCQRLGDRARLSFIEGADHSFHVPKRAGSTDAEVLSGLAETAAAWIRSIIA
jgi:predicted alpha/beta-hydrolase family hydrolase